MSINISEAISFSIKEPGGVLKVFIGGIILLLASLLSNISGLKPMLDMFFNLGSDFNYILLALLGVILNLAIFGYGAAAANNCLIEDEYIKMPEWSKILNHCLTGFLAALTTFIYSIPSLIIYGILLFMVFTKSTDQTLMITLLIAAVILQLILVPAALIMFVKNLNILDIFRPSFIFKTIIKNFFGIILIDISIVVCFILLSILMVLTLFILSPFIAFMMNMAVFNLYAQGAQNFLAEEE